MPNRISFLPFMDHSSASRSVCRDTLPHQEDNTIIKRNMWESAQTLPSVCTYTRTGQVGPFSNACLDVGLLRIGYGWVSCWALIRLQQPKHVPNNPKHTCRWETRWLSGKTSLASISTVANFDNNLCSLRSILLFFYLPWLRFKGRPYSACLKCQV